MKVSSFVNMGDYTVTATNGLPSGSKIVNMNGQEQNAFSGNEHFKIAIPTNSITSDMDVTVAVRARCETYPVFFGASPSSNLQDYALTFDPMADEQGIANFKIDVHKATIKVIKEDSELKYRIPNVVFNFKYADGENIGNYTTNSVGEITIDKLRPGTVIATELQTDKNYILNNEQIEIKLSYADEIVKSIENERKKGNLLVYKVDKDNNKIALGNVLFNLFSHEQQKVIGSYRTDVNGRIFIENLRVADYSLIERETNKWYNLAEDSQLQIKWNETTEITVQNELKKSQIRVIKVDKDNHEIKLKNVKLGVFDENDNLLETIVTNNEGEALTQEYPVRDFEKLKIVELETLQEYVLDSEPRTIELKENEIVDVVFENERIKGTVEITKVDKNDNSKTLAGVTLGVYDMKDNLIETLVTDENGKATTSKLYKMKGYIKELDTGSVYYLLNPKKYEFEIIKHKEVIPVTIENEGTDIEVDVDKTGTVEIKPGEDVNYTFTNVANNSNVYLENFKWYDYIPTDYIRLQKMTTGIWNQDLTYSVYYKTNKSEDYILFKENLNTKENYDLDFTTVELTEDEYITETCFDFGKVEKGFRENTSPTMNCKSLDTLKDNDTFTNHTKTVGVYFDITAESNSKWTTITHIPEEIHEETLPKTGK